MQDRTLNKSMAAGSAAARTAADHIPRPQDDDDADCCSDKNVGKYRPNTKVKDVPQCCRQQANFKNARAYLTGALSAFAVVGIYLGMNTLTADWYFAGQQFGEYRWWIISLAVGLGVQVSLYSLFRAHHRGRRKTAANSSLAASGGVSAVAMMACCAHYLAAVIPLLGVSFLSATAMASVARYQSYFFLAGVVSCIFGIGLMIRMMGKHGMFHSGVPEVVLRIKAVLPNNF